MLAVASSLAYCSLVSSFPQEFMVSTAYRFRPRVENILDSSFFLSTNGDVERYTAFVMSASQVEKNKFGIAHVDDSDNLSVLCMKGNVITATLSSLRGKDFICMLDECADWYEDLTDDSIQIDCKFAIMEISPS